MARGGEEGGKKRVERAINRFRAISRLHVGVAVPQFAARLVREIFVNCRYARVPHVAALRVTKQEPPLPEILVVRIDAAADMAIAVRPGACLSVYVLPDETQRRAALIGFDQRAFRFLVENWLAGQFA